MKTFCLTLDLHDDPALIAEYRWYHRPENIWPAVVANIKAAGILREQIYLLGNRLVMLLETADGFSFESRATSGESDPEMQKWEQLMWKYQMPLPQARPGEKWVLMEKIFDLE